MTRMDCERDSRLFDSWEFVGFVVRSSGSVVTGEPGGHLSAL